MQPLPIDPYLPAIRDALRARGAVVVVAEPGAGKTTRLPRSLLDGGFAERGERREIVVLEPRRLAARLAAARVAEELGESVGGRVGYTVRFEDRSGPATRVRFVTEGVLVRRLASDPHLDGVAAILVDEFHERSLHADLALALVGALRASSRPDLAVAVMSATLDAGPVAEFLGAPVFEVPGRPYPVDVEYVESAGAADGRPLEVRAAAAVRRLVAEEPEGHVLVFLPGAAEIRRMRAELDAWAAREDIALAPLHGELPLADQDRAVRPGPRRTVILATNVAETSLTIDGVHAVVDSGLHRLAGHSPWSGLPTLDVRPISRASAAQRAGRAGRTGPGRCVRLYSRHDHDHRPAHDAPEIARADLTELVLLCAALGDDAPRAWLTPPPPAAWVAAQELLGRLGAIESGKANTAAGVDTAAGASTAAGAITAAGRAMLRVPAHARAARVLLAAVEAGAGRRGALCAALLGEREVRLASRTRFDTASSTAAAGAVTDGPSDILDAADLLDEAERRGANDAAFRAAGLDVAAARAALRARDQLLRAAGAAGAAGVRENTSGTADDTAPLLRAVLAGFPDRVARRRAKGAADVVFAGGGSGRLAPFSVVQSAMFLVALDAAEQRGRGTVVHSASAVEPEWLIDLFPERVRDEREVVFNPKAERVEAVERLVYDGLTLDEARRSDATGPDVDAALLAAARVAGVHAFVDDPDAIDRLAARVAFAREAGAHDAGAREAGATAALAPLDAGLVDTALAALCAGRRSFRELREAGVMNAIHDALGPGVRARLERIAPERITLASGRTARVEYAPGRPPYVGSYLQDFFGQREGPKLGGIPLVIHLWAPSRRPLQVTTDLAGFWSRHYPALRTQLMRRYPKHRWPEDPLAP